MVLDRIEFSYVIKPYTYITLSFYYLSLKIIAYDVLKFMLL